MEDLMMSDDGRRGSKRPPTSLAVENAAQKRPRSSSTSKKTPIQASRGSDMFADFDFRTTPRASSSRTTTSNTNGKRKQPSFKVPDTKEMLAAFSLPMSDLDTAKPPPKLPPRSSVSIHDQLRSGNVPISPLRIGGGSVLAKEKGKERQITPLRTRPLAFPVDGISGAPIITDKGKAKRFVTPNIPRINTTPVRKVVPLNSLFGLPKDEPTSPSSTSSTTAFETPSKRDAMPTLPGPRFALGIGALVPKTPLRNVTPAPFDAFAKLEGQLAIGGEVEDEHTKELNRGLLVSPEKEGGKGRKFVRNGLAERAQHLIARSRMAFTLWSKDLDSSSSKSISASALATSSVRHRPDIRLRLLSTNHVLWASSAHSRSSGTNIRSIQARCHILHGPPELTALFTPTADVPVPNSGRMSTPKRDFQNEDILSFHPQTVTDDLDVLFSFHAHEHSDFSLRLLGLASLRNDSVIPEGCEIHVWKPWYTVTTSTPFISLDRPEKTSFGTSVNNGREDGDVFSISAGSDQKHKPKITKPPLTLMCSRFLVIPLAAVPS